MLRYGFPAALHEQPWLHDAPTPAPLATPARAHSIASHALSRHAYRRAVRTGVLNNATMAVEVGDPNKAATFAQQLVLADKVDLIIGPVNSGGADTSKAVETADAGA